MKSYWLKITVGLSFCVGLIQGCVLDDAGPVVPIEQSECRDLKSPPKPYTEWSTVFPNYSEGAVCFSPYDPNDVIYVRHYTTVQADTIFRYNILTLQRQFLGALNANSMDWGPNDWILIEGNGIYKVKANGDSLTNLHLPGIPSRLTMSPEGDRFAVFINQGIHSGFRISDLNGHFLDTIPLISVQDWYASDSVLGFAAIDGTQEFGIYSWKLSTNEKRLMTYVPLEGPSPTDGTLSVKMFHDRERIAILTWKGLWVYHSKTDELRKLASSCDSRRIMSVRIAPNQQDLLVEELGFASIEANAIKSNYAVVKLNAETGERQDTLFYQEAK